MDAPPVQYVRTSDGYNIAFRVTGSGPPLLFIPPNLSDIELVWRFYPHWLEGLARRFRLIQYDSRGEGLSTRNLSPAVTMADFDRDIEAVVERLRLDRFFIWGFAARSHLAVRYAVAHPERVAGLILNTCSESNLVWKPVLFAMLPEENWEVFLNQMTARDLSAEERRRRVNEFRTCCTHEDWNAWVGVARPSNVAEQLGRLRVPTLVLHPRGFPTQPAEESMRVAAQIPDARFLLIDGNYVFGDAHQGLAAIDSFLSDLKSVSQPSSADKSALSVREIEVLRLIAAGKSNQQIAEELVISPSTVAKHLNSIFAKGGFANRTEAAAYAHRNSLV
jgi:pimeloyl-ACP methyl ester carboxylesterase/DNA-binding CsgD family transcriptional regulator